MSKRNEKKVHEYSDYCDLDLFNVCSLIVEGFYA